SLSTGRLAARSHSHKPIPTALPSARLKCRPPCLHHRSMLCGVQSPITLARSCGRLA
ncbi:hypothetical protein BaRGS_00034152, partial [Batillaria attramentaria]